MGDLDGAQAEYVRVPDADVNLLGIALDDEEVLFAGDILTTGFYAAALADIRPGETVVVVGAGPVALFCAAAASNRGASQVLVLDTHAGRVSFAARYLESLAALVAAVDVSRNDAQAAVHEATGGEMADVAMDVVGSIAALKTALTCVRDGGRVAVVGVYGKERYELPLGKVWVRGLDLRFGGMASIQQYWRDAVMAVREGTLDPTGVITHRLPLDHAEEGYELFAAREAMKVVLTQY